MYNVIISVIFESEIKSAKCFNQIKHLYKISGFANFNQSSSVFCYGVFKTYALYFSINFFMFKIIYSLCSHELLIKTGGKYPFQFLMQSQPLYTLPPQI